MMYVCVLVSSSLYEDRESVESAGLELAKVSASKSPVAVQGSKVNLVYSRDHSVTDALEYAVRDGGSEGHRVLAYYALCFVLVSVCGTVS